MPSKPQAGKHRKPGQIIGPWKLLKVLPARQGVHPRVKIEHTVTGEVGTVRSDRIPQVKFKNRPLEGAVIETAPGIYATILDNTKRDKRGRLLVTVLWSCHKTVKAVRFDKIQDKTTVSCGCVRSKNYAKYVNETPHGVDALTGEPIYGKRVKTA